MKKSILSLVALSFLTFSCASDDDENGGNGGRTPDPIISLSTPPISYGAIINAGAVLPKAVMVEGIRRLAEMEGEDRIFVVHLPTSGSIFFDPARHKLENFIQGLGGANDFYVNSDLYANDPALDYTALAPVGTPVGAVNHRLTQMKVDSVIINARVEFFESSNKRKFYVGSYLCAEFNADTDPVTGVSFNVPAIPNTIATVNGVSMFSRNFPNDSVVAFANNEMFKYQYVVISEPIMHPLGIRLDSVNLFGREFEMGDVLGTRETPLRFALPRHYTHLERIKGLAVWTVLFEVEEEIDPADPDGPPLVDYVILNSFLSKI